MNYKEILEEQLQLLREIAQKRRYTADEVVKISQSMVEIVKCIEEL